jgi:hypothetical protein
VSTPSPPTYLTPPLRIRIRERFIDRQHRLGRNVNHDPHSLRYQVGQPTQVLKSVEHEHVIPILQQGDLGACTGFAGVGALGTQPLYDALPEEHPDLDGIFARSVYSDATELDAIYGVWPPKDTGSDGLSVAKVLKRDGLISGYLTATSLAAMRNALQTTPVSVGTNWYATMDHPDSDGLIRVGGERRGGHQYLVIGMSEEKQLFTCVQSWGPSWGERGIFYISYADMDRLLHEKGDCTAMLPFGLPSPKPSPVVEAVPSWWPGKYVHQVGDWFNRLRS